MAASLAPALDVLLAELGWLVLELELPLLLIVAPLPGDETALLSCAEFCVLLVLKPALAADELTTIALLFMELAGALAVCIREPLNCVVPLQNSSS